MPSFFDYNQCNLTPKVWECRTEGVEGAIGKPPRRLRRGDSPCPGKIQAWKCCLLEQIPLNNFERVQRPIPMAAFIPMRRIHASANQPMANVIPRPQGRFHIRPVVADTHPPHSPPLRALRGGNQLPHDIIAVRPAGVLRADGHLPFGALHALRRRSPCPPKSPPSRHPAPTPSRHARLPHTP